jgi:hypothetical protein
MGLKMGLFAREEPLVAAGGSERWAGVIRIARLSVVLIIVSYLYGGRCAFGQQIFRSL